MCVCVCVCVCVCGVGDAVHVSASVKLTVGINCPKDSLNVRTGGALEQSGTKHRFGNVEVEGR